MPATAILALRRISMLCLLLEVGMSFPSWTMAEKSASRVSCLAKLGCAAKITPAKLARSYLSGKGASRQRCTVISKALLRSNTCKKLVGLGISTYKCVAILSDVPSSSPLTSPKVL